VGGSLLVRGREQSVQVDASECDLAQLPARRAESARKLLGGAARGGLVCSFEGPVTPSESWTVVVDIARAVAADVPLAVLDDHAGTTYLVHPKLGLVAPSEYEKVRHESITSELLRKLLGH
jgi:hypothetical protein